ncbi:SMI1/KNR4 family protein [Streptomyces sp. NPDC048436]|uniref:SMI1/KNR4 family protein n=1 Tax=Streptomyces sp. NPDC048436 TaxID=3365550 RepID=UPI0037245F5F
MGIREAEEFVQLVMDNPEESIFAGGRSDEEIADAEQRLGTTFPASYKYFLRELGDCDVAGEEIHGIVIREGRDLGVVKETLDLRESMNMPHSLVAFRPDGMGGYFAIDTSQMDEGGEAPVYVYGDGAHSPTDLEYIGPDFGSVALNLARRGLRGNA